MRPVHNVWRKSFALLPCRVDTDTLVWLDYVERKIEQYWRGDHKKYKWVYREIMCQRAREAREAEERQAMGAARQAAFLQWGEAVPMPNVGWDVAEPQGAMEPR